MPRTAHTRHERTGRTESSLRPEARGRAEATAGVRHLIIRFVGKVTVAQRTGIKAVFIRRGGISSRPGMPLVSPTPVASKPPSLWALSSLQVRATAFFIDVWPCAIGMALQNRAMPGHIVFTTRSTACSGAKQGAERGLH